jgi:hypothetical protein
MSLYFTAAVWASLALCLVSCLEDRLPRYRAETLSIKQPQSATMEMQGSYRPAAQQ